MIEIDILPASSKKKGGDSALIRFGTFNYDNLRNNQTVLLIDGGYSENSERIKEYLRDYYKTDTIDLVIITHPDIDHISGFKNILIEGGIKIKETYIHDPWEHSTAVFKKTEDGRRTSKSISNKFDETLKCLSETLDLLGSKNTEPFSGLYSGKISTYILGPDKDFYQELLYKYPGMEGESTGTTSDIYSESEVAYDSSLEHFLDNPETTPKNATSVITLILDSKKNPIALFTGDAGIESINRALDYAEKNGIPYSGVSLFQIPHHGSLKNIDKGLINRINPQRVYVSAPPEKMEHPSKLLLNYFNNLGKRVFHIQDKSGIRFSFDDAPARPGWTAATPVKSYSLVNKIKSKFHGKFWL